MTKMKRPASSTPKKKYLVIQEKQWNNIMQHVKRNEEEALQKEADEKMLDYLKRGSEELKKNWPENNSEILEKETVEKENVEMAPR